MNNIHVEQVYTNVIILNTLSKPIIATHANFQTYAQNIQRGNENRS